ncbi:hypothetical protein ACH5AO_11290 [Streptomyces sp. NPDC018964]|uniref:hypothetical protein n=1 Tax=Streptomyces sp. NPDC018964 TaxID=3365058 RepID=UPI0037AB1150
MGRIKVNKPRRPRRTTTPVEQELRALVGERIPGGCDHCNADQVLKSDVSAPGIFMLNVQHNDGCRWYAEHCEGMGR